MQQIYGALGLEDFSGAEPAMRAYVDTLAGYKNNKHGELTPALVARIGQEWHRSFEEWGYSPQPNVRPTSPLTPLP